LAPFGALKFIPWIAGTILFMAAGTITSKFVSVEEDTFIAL
jgi:hypothetical protein